MSLPSIMHGIIKECPNVQQQSLSCCAFGPDLAHQLIVAGAWDGKVKCWEVEKSQGLNIKETNEGNAEVPILSCAWDKDNQGVFVACADNSVKKWRVELGNFETVGKHQAPARVVKYIQSLDLVCSGGLDKMVYFWDARQSQPAHKIELTERCYAMDCNFPFLVVAQASRHVEVYDVSNTPQLLERSVSKLDYQNRCVGCFVETHRDHAGFILASIEGRASVQYLNQPQKNFVFKCHRAGNPPLVYPVHDIKFHPKGTFATVGGDGAVNFWDKNARTRLKQFPAENLPVVSCDFAKDGNLFCYATSYDWSRGPQTPNTKQPNALKVHITVPSEINPK